MACNHFRIPISVQISSTRVIRCKEAQLHRIQYFRCAVCHRETFMYPAQAQRLALYNLITEEKARLGVQAIKDLHTRLPTGVPVTSNYFRSEYSPGFDYAYVHEKSVIYQQERAGGIIEVEDSEEED